MSAAARRALRTARPFTPGHEARRRITSRYELAGHFILHPGDALYRVSEATRLTAKPPNPEIAMAKVDPPTERDALDALMQVDMARLQIELDELRLILYLRHLGATWERIGEALGYGAGSEPGKEKIAQMKGAQARCTALAKRHPKFATNFDAALEALNPDGEQ